MVQFFGKSMGISVFPFVTTRRMVFFIFHDKAYYLIKVIKGFLTFAGLYWFKLLIPDCFSHMKLMH